MVPSVMFYIFTFELWGCEGREQHVCFQKRLVAVLTGGGDGIRIRPLQ